MKNKYLEIQPDWLELVTDSNISQLVLPGSWVLILDMD